VDGHSILRKLIKDFDLCPRLCFMQDGSEPCDSSCLGACEQREKPEEYNRRVQDAVASLQKEPSYAIVDKGVNGNDKSCILVLNGKLYGMGYLPEDVQVTNMEALKDYLQPYKENSFIRNLLNGYSARYPSKIIRFNDVATNPATESFHQLAFG
ncbi:MAG TPA: hypothetical protein VFP87_14355, partial [Chitinophagaceae bacterium]|nr:hypothetical protein [Chitinophagaceae bacterium]